MSTECQHQERNNAQVVSEENSSRSPISTCLLSHGDSCDRNAELHRPAHLSRAEWGIHTRSRRREAVVFVLVREDGWLRQQHVHLGVDAGESPRDVKCRR